MIVKLLPMCLLSAAAWMVCEVIGGLTFLAFGLRLWRYHIAPLAWDITSPVVWGIAFVLMGPLLALYESWERRQPPNSLWRVPVRLAFLAVCGCILEVLLNNFLFMGLIGKPLYTYAFLPTFSGSGSLLSPLYYSTLYLHFPLNRWLVRRRTLLTVDDGAYTDGCE